MEASPLTQQNRQEVFEPKIVQLYREAFSVDEDVVLSEGFWRELFLLRADKTRLIEVLDALTADDFLSIQSQTREFFRRAVDEAGSANHPRNENALENITAFLISVLSKRYTNPSADIIEVLAGLDAVDKWMNDLSSDLDLIIKTSPQAPLRNKAIKASLALVAGGYQTTLASYFTHRDLFPGLVKVADSPDNDGFVGFVLLGILANLNKFEIHNPYQNRLEDFVHAETMQRLVQNIGTVYETVRDSYVAVHDDSPETWTETTLHLVGIKNWPSQKRQPQPSEEQARDLLLLLPPPTAAISLPTYSFVFANKFFASTLVATSATSGHESPLSSFLSATSYLGHNAYRSKRCLHYTLLHLLILQILIEDPITVKHLCSSDHKLTVRLCRQRPPQLPQTAGPRIPAAVILDISIDILTHNLRKRLDVSLYAFTLGILLRTAVHLSTTRTRLAYHWPSLWFALLSVIRFLVKYATGLLPTPNIREAVCMPLASLLAFCLSRADNFLPDPRSYDDLFYKTVEASPVLHQFRDVYCPAQSSLSEMQKLSRAAEALTSVSSHYHGLLQSAGGKKHQSPAAVEEVIRQGHETLDLGASSGGSGGVEEFGRFDNWKEGNAKGLLKGVIRTVVEDAKRLAEE